MQNQDLSKLPSNTVIERLQTLVAHERKITAEVIEYVKEVDRRRIYLDLGYTSLFAYMTEGLGYTGGAAQRRIDSARLMSEIPEIKEDLKSGALNLMQVSMLAHCVRQKQKEEPTAKVEVKDKREMLELLKNHDLQKTQVILAKKLDLEIKAQEKTTHQRDESVRLETAFSKEQMAEFTRVKELISHTHPNIGWAELMSFLAKAYLKKNDPLLQPLDKRKKGKTVETTKTMEAASSSLVFASTASASASAATPTSSAATAKMAVSPIVDAASMAETEICTRNGSTLATKGADAPTYSYRSARSQRLIHQRDQVCQWINPRTGKLCSARFQLQTDHIIPRWAGGTDEPEKLQILCSVHNVHRYRRQAQTIWK